jgi:DNA-binding NarL/FixJ family response regulator
MGRPRGIPSFNGPTGTRFPRAVLTPRQVEFIEALSAGKTMREIAREFGCCHENVRDRIAEALKRTGNKTREQLCVWWFIQKWNVQLTISKGEAA